jgi:poly(A) polymerase
MTDILEALCNAGFSAYLCGFSAIDSWLGREKQIGAQVLTNADVSDLARLFENLRYPGIDIADAAFDEKDRTWYFRCFDSIRDNHPSFTLLEFYQDYKSRVFYDPRGMYPVLAGIRRNIHVTRKLKIADTAADTKIETDPLEIFREGLNRDFDLVRSLMDASLILAKYFPPDTGAERYIKETAEFFSGEVCSVYKYNNEKSGFQKNSLWNGPAPCQEEQRILLSSLLTSPNPGLGLELLKNAGFIEKFWSELAILDEADHAKEFHPEGNAWKHTMETFRYRKNYACDLLLSLGLLLHDSGKPIAVSANSRRFDGHAELGEVQAHRFLGRLGFGASLINDVCFLVRNHMLPAALPRLPFSRTGKIMASPLFPTLMELYRCDESSSFKGLDGYYESSAVYQSYLRNRRNPYRSADGKKLNRKQMSGSIKF